METPQGQNQGSPAHDYDDRSTLELVLPAAFFMFIGMLVGTFISYNAFIFPDYFSGEFFTFGRLRPMHVAHVALLWLLTFGMGVFYYITQRLCGCRLYSRKLAAITHILWYAGAVPGIYSFPLGTSSGWEYAEIPVMLGIYPVKIIMTIAWVLFSMNILMTISKRRYQQMYVSLWYIMGAVVWTTFTWVAGNFVIHFIPEGITRVNLNFFYVHNLVGLIFTPMGLAASYYFIPRVTGAPIYSHRLSMLGFWSIAFFYSWVGAHHLIHGPISQWLQTISIVFSVWLIIPVFAVVINFFMTIFRGWEHYSEKVSLRFLTFGTLFYLLTSVQGSLMSLRNINEITSKTDWVIGHAHLALLGAFTFFALGAFYHLTEVIAQRPIWSKRLACWHFNLMLFGSMLMFLTLMAGGYFQGLEWAKWARPDLLEGEVPLYSDYQRQMALKPFLETIKDLLPWWSARGVSGLVLLFANGIFLFNISQTLMESPRRNRRGLSYVPKRERDQEVL